MVVRAQHQDTVDSKENDPGEDHTGEHGPREFHQFRFAVKHCSSQTHASKSHCDDGDCNYGRVQRAVRS